MLPKEALVDSTAPPVALAILPAAAGVMAGALVFGKSAFAVAAGALVAAAGLKGAATPPAICAALGLGASDFFARSEGNAGAEFATAVESAPLPNFHHAVRGAVLQPAAPNTMRANSPAATVVCFMASVPYFDLRRRPFWATNLHVGFVALFASDR
jgi:hypothetical protein